MAQADATMSQGLPVEPQGDTVMTLGTSVANKR